MVETLDHPDGSVSITDTDGKRRVEVHPNSKDLFIARSSCITTYPTPLIELILRVKGVGWLCDEIDRDEDPDYVQKHLLTDLDTFFDRSEIDGKRILDFGCGSGASTSILGRTFKDATIVGVELVDEFLDIARRRAGHQGLSNVEFMASPDAMNLPADIGDFDIVIMSAVVEHLLPSERKALLPLLWQHVRPGGALFIDETPYRWFPIELHTTMLPLINYLPDRLTATVSRRFSKRIDPDTDWNELLRAGIRGSTIREIRGFLSEAGAAVPIIPLEGSGQVDLWFRKTSRGRLRPLKAAAQTVLSAVERGTGVGFVPDIAVAFRKPS